MRARASSGRERKRSAPSAMASSNQLCMQATKDVLMRVFRESNWPGRR
jgi:hypothetical protein